MKRVITIFAVFITAMSAAACGETAADQKPATEAVNSTMAVMTTETTAASTATTTEIERDHAERLKEWLDVSYTRSLNSMADSLKDAITYALERLENPKKFDGAYQHALPDEILEIMRPICRWYDDKSAMTDFAVRIKDGKVSAVWTERNVQNDLQDRLKKIKESNRNWETEYCSEAELWTNLGFADYDAYISVLENWGAMTYYGAFPTPTVSRFDTTEESSAGNSNVKPDLEKVQLQAVQ